MGRAGPKPNEDSEQYGAALKGEAEERSLRIPNGPNPKLRGEHGNRSRL
jgi:hypothetical protein